jgi:hypothetical protein
VTSALWGCDWLASMRNGSSALPSGCEMHAGNGGIVICWFAAGYASAGVRLGKGRRSGWEVPESFLQHVIHTYLLQPTHSSLSGVSCAVTCGMLCCAVACRGIQPDHFGVLALPVAEFLAVKHGTAYLGYSQQSSTSATHPFFASGPPSTGSRVVHLQHTG